MGMKLDNNKWKVEIVNKKKTKKWTEDVDADKIEGKVHHVQQIHVLLRKIKELYGVGTIAGEPDDALRSVPTWEEIRDIVVKRGDPAFLPAPYNTWVGNRAPDVALQYREQGKIQEGEGFPRTAVGLADFIKFSC